MDEASKTRIPQGDDLGYFMLLSAFRMVTRYQSRAVSHAQHSLDECGAAEAGDG